MQSAFAGMLPSMTGVDGERSVSQLMAEQMPPGHVPRHERELAQARLRARQAKYGAGFTWTDRDRLM